MRFTLILLVLLVLPFGVTVRTEVVNTTQDTVLVFIGNSLCWVVETVKVHETQDTGTFLRTATYWTVLGESDKPSPDSFGATQKQMEE